MGFIKKRERITMSIPAETVHEGKQDVQDEGSEYMAMSTPFFAIGKEDLTTPYIDDRVIGPGGYVAFDVDNLFPQRTNILYFKSPANAACIQFKIRGTIGGGYTYEHTDDIKIKAEVMAFNIRFRIEELLDVLMLDRVQHGSAYIHVKFRDDNGVKFPYYMKRIPREKVRTNKTKTLYFISEDWSREQPDKTLKPYTGTNIQKEHIICYEDVSPGSDVYSIPSYASALNWCAVDGEMSMLHKNNILTAIFPSAVFNYPRVPRNEEEKREIKKDLEQLKGARNAGKIVSLFSKKEEFMPKITSFTPSQNDKLFEQTDERIDAQIYKAHVIDPLIMGIRVPGKLGSGNELRQSYTIFEKNTIMPLRKKAEAMINELLDICGIRAKIKINNFQIIDEVIVETEDQATKALNALNNMSPLMANKFLESVPTEKLLSLIPGLSDEK